MTIEAIDPSSLRRGDIVVFESPLAGLVVHRLMWKVPPLGAPRAVFTKGDALEHFDRPTAVTEVLGRVVEVERGRTRTRIGGVAARLRWLAAAAAWGWKRGFGGTGRKALIHRENR